MRFNSRDPQGQVPADILSQTRHLSYFDHYFRWLDEAQPAEPAARRVTIIARSPISPVIQAMQAAVDDLEARRVAVQTVFSDVDPERALRSTWDVISRLSRGREHGDLLRWASAPGILEAHEQMILGRRMSWLGDAMRREPGRRDGFDLFDEDALDSCDVGVKSFSAMWQFATPVPRWRLRDPDERRPNAALAGPDRRALETLSFFSQLGKSDTHYH